LRRLQERFLATVSHELRTPLTSLLASLQLLARRSSPDGNARPPGLAIALRQVQLLKLLVDDLSDLGRIQGAKIQLAIEKLDFAKLLGQIIDGLNLVPIENEKPRPIVFRTLPEGESISIAGDPLRVEQIVTNLLVNARKYAQNSERIDVQLRQVDGMADLQVTDYGPGIPATDLPQLFSPFYQVVRSGAQTQGGLGLGLFITRGLVEAHDGTITVRSVEGRGTTFTVRLPLLDRVNTAMITDHQGVATGRATLDYGD
jgi:signal transduction histidine kinase